MQLNELLKHDELLAKNGIYVHQLIAERTVWDNLATKNPTHAVISAPDEAAAAKKSEAQITELAADLVDGVVLDLGCGYGRIAKYLLPKRQFAGYVGLDSAYEMLTLFKRRHDTHEEEQGTPVAFINADIHTIPLRDNTVDNVVVAAVFLHNHKSVVEQSLNEISRVLKPGGRLFVYGSFPNKWSLMGLQGTLYQWYLNLIGNPFKNGPVRYYSKREILALLSSFAVVDLRPAGFAVLPKRLIFLPGFLDNVWRRGVANPINRVFEKLFPVSLERIFAVHYDVTATK